MPGMAETAGGRAPPHDNDIQTIARFIALHDGKRVASAVLYDWMQPLEMCCLCVCGGGHDSCHLKVLPLLRGLHTRDSLDFHTYATI